MPNSAQQLSIGPDRISTDATLDELGIDSLAVLDLVTEIDFQLGVELDVELLLTGPSIREIAAGLVTALHTDG